MNENRSLVIWFNNGKTAMFKNVENFNHNEKALFFDYFGESTQVKRNAFFKLDSIAGYASQE